MILNKLANLSYPRLLHVALSFLCVLALVLGLASGALAASGDSSGYFTDFSFFTRQSTLYYSLISAPLSSTTGNSLAISTLTGSTRTFYLGGIYLLPYSLKNAGSITLHYSVPYPVTNFSSYYTISLKAFSVDGDQLESFGYSEFNSDFTWSVPAKTAFIALTIRYYSTYNSTSYSTKLDHTFISYSNFVYDEDSAISQDVLDGITAIAQSLYDLEQGPYYGVSGVSIDQNGDLQHTLTQNASLEDLLNALGIAGTDTNHVIRGIYNNFGSYFTLYSIDDSTSGTTQVYRGLPQYVNALGQSVTDGINRLQRDHDLLFQQTADLSDALYADTLESPSESWSVAEWLRGIFTSITDFISSFWSPAESDLKEAAEDGMQDAADRCIAASADQVGDMDDLGSGFASFGSTGNVGAGDLLDSLTSGDYSFFSQTTQDNLGLHPPVSQNRGFRSAPSDPVEYVDELSKNRAALQEVLGLP